MFIEGVVFVYYEKTRVSEDKLLKLWKDSWETQGWRTQILNESIAKMHPDYEEAKQIWKKFRTTNPPEYEMACFMRWLAMAVIGIVFDFSDFEGGGYMSDWDTINYSFPPRPTYRRLMSFSGPVPALISGSAEEYTRIARHFINFKPTPDMKVASDMIILSLSKEIFDALSFIPLYNRDGWKTAPLVHYNFEATKAKCIELDLLRQRGACIPFLRPLPWMVNSTVSLANK